MTLPTDSHPRPRRRFAAADAGDYSTSVVPEGDRYSTGKMTVLWFSLQANINVMYAGFLARSEGLSLGTVIVASVVAIVVMMAYGLAAANLGARTGQTHSVLARTVLGKTGSGLASVMLIVAGLGWYGFQALFLAQILQALFGFSSLTGLSILAAALGFVMIANNLFGFKGLANYARYLAGPLLFLWLLVATIKGFATVPAHVLFLSPHIAPSTTFMILLGALVGSAMWGNEPDFFRYSRERPGYNAVPLIVGYGLGSLLFPVAGYLMAELSGATAFGPVIRYFVHFSLFGLTALAVVVFVANLVALNDGALYEALNGVENIIGRKTRPVVLVLGVLGAAVAVLQIHIQNSFFIVANIGAVFLPCVTVVMAVDVLVLPRIGWNRPLREVRPWSATPMFNPAGLVAVVAGVLVGSFTAGLVPGVAGYGKDYIGFPALQAWATAVVIYFVAAAIICRRDTPSRRRLLGYRNETAGTESAPVEAVA